MGRTLAALLVLGLLAAGGWFLHGRFGGGEPDGGLESGTEATGDGVPGSTVAPGDGAAGAPPVSGFAPEGPRAPGRETAPPSSRPEETGIPRVAAGPAATEIRGMVQAGKAREAVARSLSLPAESLRDPACAAAARDAALALAAASASGPADRLVRADAARRLLGKLVVAEAIPMAAVKDRLDGLNKEVLFAGREVPGVVFKSAVKPGDTLDRLMKKDWKGRVRAGYGLVLWMNNIPGPDRLRVGGIWVPEEPVRVLVHKSAHRLWVLLGDVPIREFSVGLGMNGRTPEGIFEIEEMMPRPDYYPPGGRRIPFGQKGNPLGTRWMGFRDTADAQGFGIHGTDDPLSIGKDESQGCVRMRNEEVEQIFTWLTVGTTVEIRP